MRALLLCARKSIAKQALKNWTCHKMGAIMKIIKINKRVSIFSAILMLLLNGCDTNDKAEMTEPASNFVALDQGWNKDEELDFV